MKNIDEALALQTKEAQAIMSYNVDLKVQELFNTGKIELIVPLPLKTIRWLYDPESKILLISESLKKENP